MLRSTLLALITAALLTSPPAHSASRDEDGIQDLVKTCITRGSRPSTCACVPQVLERQGYSKREIIAFGHTTKARSLHELEVMNRYSSDVRRAEMICTQR